MQAATLTDLTNIARAGARKMDAQGYTITAVTAVQNVYRVTNPDGKTYRVSTKQGATSCGCKFYSENRFNKFQNPNGFSAEDCTCKHIEKCKQEEAYIARIEQAAEERFFADFNIETGYDATR